MTLAAVEANDSFPVSRCLIEQRPVTLPALGASRWESARAEAPAGPSPRSVRWPFARALLVVGCDRALPAGR